MGSGKRKTMRERFLQKETSTSTTTNTPLESVDTPTSSSTSRLPASLRKQSKLSRKEAIKTKRPLKVRASATDSKDLPPSSSTMEGKRKKQSTSTSKGALKKRKIIENIIKRKVIPDKESNRLHWIKQDVAQFDATLQQWNCLPSTSLPAPSSTLPQSKEEMAEQIHRYYSTTTTTNTNATTMNSSTLAPAPTEGLNPFEAASAYLSENMERLLPQTEQVGRAPIAVPSESQGKPQHH